ncbi:sorting nexin 14-like isoform B, partial [Leptotrombidium deliense]
MFVEGKRKAKNALLLEQFVLNEYKNEIHRSIKSIKHETKWLSDWCDFAIPILVPPKCAPLFHVFIKEFLVFNIFHPLIELISDPYNINSFVITFFEDFNGNKKSSIQAKQFLKSFVAYNKQNNENVLGIKMKEIINDEKLLFLFMKYLKSEGVVNLLQFILTLNNLNEKMFSPNFNQNDFEEVRDSMQETYEQYLREDGIDWLNISVPINQSLDFSNIKNKEDLEKLNLILFDAYEQVFVLLENFYLKHFLESDLFMKLIVGHRKCLLN